MRKKTTFTLFLITLIPLLTSNLYAGFGDILLSGAESWEIITRANHWQAFLAGSILTACWLGLSRMKKTDHKEFARAKAFFLYVTGSICICLVVAEYWAAILYVIGIFYSIFEFTKELTTDIYDTLTD